MRKSVYRLTISDENPAGYSHQKISGPDVFFKKSSGVVVPLEEHLTIDPLIVRYADGTYSYNCYHIPTNLNAGSFPSGSMVMEGHSAQSGIDGKKPVEEYDPILGIPRIAG